MTTVLASATTIKNLPMDDTIGFVYKIPCETDEPEIVFMVAYSAPDFRGKTRRTVWNARYNESENMYEWYVNSVKQAGVIHGSSYRVYRQPDPFDDKTRVLDQAGRFIFQ